MKKIIAIATAILMAFSVTVSAHSFSEQLLPALNVMPELSYRANDVVTRDAFAAIAAAIAGFSDMLPSETAFSDVTAENSFSGAVRLMKEGGYMSGVSETEFAPAEPVTVQQALSVFVKLLGYQTVAESLGGWPDGYALAAHRLGLYKGISKGAWEPMTYSELWALCDVALDVPMADTSYMSENGVVGELLYVRDDMPTLMEKALHIYHYKGVVNGIEDESHKLTATLTRAEAGAPHRAGETVTVSASTGINILNYDKMPVELYISEDDMLVSIAPSAGVESRYAVVYSVNADETVDAKYQVSGIDRLMFLDDKTEYDVAQTGLSLYYNGKPYTGALSLAGRYVRVILQDKYVTAIEAWDVKEGGIITETTYKNISYVAGNTKKRMNETDRFNRRMIVVDGELRDFSELKKDMLFDYYISDDGKDLVIFASEKKLSDTFRGLSSEEIEIGNIFFLRADTLYASLDGTNYRESTVQDLMNKNVTAYVDVFEKVRYLKPSDGSLDTKDFLGYLLGVRQLSSLEPREMKIADLDSDDFAEGTYAMAENIRYGTGLNEASVLATAGDVNGAGLYRFLVNDKNEVKQITPMLPFYGLGTAAGPVDIPNAGETYSTVIVSGVSKRIYHDSDIRMIAMYEEDGELKFVNTDYSTMRGTSPNVIDGHFYGEEMSSEVDLLLLTGNLADARKDTTPMHGLITKKATTVDKDGEIGYNITLNGDKSFYMSEDDVKHYSLKENTYVRYMDKLLVGKSDIIIREDFDLPANMTDWDGNTGGVTTIRTGVIQKIDSKRIFFENGDVYFMSPGYCTFLKLLSGGQVKQGSYLDGLEGKTVAYSLVSDIIYMVFYE